jgi:thiol:disulfide interchange protein DsbA
MNCETIDSILDEHLVGRLEAADRQRAAEHLRGCSRCSAAWSADDALRGEAISDPAPGLFAAVQQRVRAAAPLWREAAGRGRWLWLGGAAAALAVVAIAASVPTTIIAPNFATTRLIRVLEPSAPPELSPPPAPAVTVAPLAASPFVAGRDYLVLPGATARAAASPSGKIEVTEFFMFFCFPCYSFEAALDRWAEDAPSDVALTRVPALFNPVAELQARAYYTAEVLGTLDAMQDAFFGEIHERGNALASRAALAEFFRRFGVDAATFDATFDSGEVEARMQRAAALNREYGIVATPTLVVAGRYSTNPQRPSDASVRESPWPTMLAIVDQLVAETRACHDRCFERARER